MNGRGAEAAPVPCGTADGGVVGAACDSGPADEGGKPAADGAWTPDDARTSAAAKAGCEADVLCGGPQGPWQAGAPACPTNAVRTDSAGTAA